MKPDPKLARDLYLKGIGSKAAPAAPAPARPDRQPLPKGSGTTLLPDTDSIWRRIARWFGGRS